jgi:hypothetical protein
MSDFFLTTSKGEKIYCLYYGAGVYYLGGNEPDNLSIHIGTNEPDELRNIQLRPDETITALTFTITYRDFNYMPVSEDYTFPINENMISNGETKNNQGNQEQTLIFNSTEDAFINENNPNGTMGDTNWLRCDGVPTQRIFSLIKFDLSSLNKGTKIHTATLKLYYYQESDEGNPTGHSLKIYRIISDWNEKQVSWNSRPSYASNTTAITIVPITANTWMEWNVTSDVQDFIQGSQINYGWVIIDTDEGGISYFNSKEAGNNIPYLEIKYVSD